MLDMYLVKAHHHLPIRLWSLQDRTVDWTWRYIMEESANLLEFKLGIITVCFNEHWRN